MTGISHKVLTLNKFRMLKKAVVLTRPTPARQDAPFRRQGRSERRGEAYASVRRASERCENAAGGLFQHPVS
jgi:hypothetical protein